jgi:3-deoxy-D-manno-octulosonate 8-phosphate phosphatase (KDO 8-P phosphatase)
MLSQNQLAAVQLIAFDFDGVFTDNTVYVTQRGIESVRCWRSDGLGLSLLRSIGIPCLIISTETNPVVTARARKLNIPCKQGVKDKAASILETCFELTIPSQMTMFVGNDINDIPAFNAVGLPVAVADAYPEVFPHVLYRTQKPGGFGAVREICDLVVNAKNGSLKGA